MLVVPRDWRPGDPRRNDEGREMTGMESHSEPEGATAALSQLVERTFSRAFRGYRREDVDRLLADVSKQAEELVAERDQLLGEHAELTSRVAALEHELSKLREQRETTGAAMIEAQRAADELRARGREESEQLVEDARAEVRSIRSQALVQEERIASLRDQESELRAAYRVLLQAAIERLEASEAGEIADETLAGDLRSRLAAT
jgi:DivIVA domain-containing protein